MTIRSGVPGRTGWVLDALASRISAEGDTTIRISAQTMYVLRKAVGLGHWEDGGEGFREVDGLALDMLRYLAVVRLGGKP